MKGPPAPEGWTGPEFDDSDWPRASGPFFGRGTPHQLGVLRLRGKFAVSDPARVRRLRLKLGFRGGVVAYLNGREVARSHLPDGPIGVDTPGAAYDKRAWVDSKGKPIPYPYDIAKRVRAGEKDLARRVATRTRHAGPLELPVGLLRKGTNVLALEVHRSPYLPLAAKWFARYRSGAPWVPAGVTEVLLEAVGEGIKPNVDRPQGLQVWNVDVHDRLRSDDYGDPNEPLHPIRIVGAVNGSFSGVVAIGSTRPLRKVRASVGDLVGPGGATIPASEVDVWYVLPGKINRFHSYYPNVAYDALSPTPPAEVTPAAVKPDSRARRALHLPPAPVPAALLPIWVKVHVPDGTRPGTYAGKLTIVGQGLGPVVVPLRLEVAPWRVPEPRRFRTYVGMYQSPTSLALKYGVKMWSDRHWELMDRSFALLEQVGNNLVNVPVVEQTQFGNDEGMVRWVRRPEGGFEYDLSILDRYLRLVKKHLGVPRFVVLHVWHSGGWKTRPVDQKNTVTVVDPRSGRTEHMQVPTFGTPESRAFWAPALRAVRERLARYGMDKSMCLGILSDGTAAPEVFAEFAAIAPGVGWMRGAHSQTWATQPVLLRGGGRVVLWEFVYGLTIADPAEKVHTIWNHTGPGVAFLRSDFDHASPLRFRTATARALLSRTRGIGRLCLDYFLMTQGKRRHCVLFNRYPHSTVGQRQPTIYHLAWAGPEGPAPTVRFELFREGLQETEALIRVAEAEAIRREALGADLARRCREVVLEQVNFDRVVHHVGGAGEWFYTGWQGRSRRLFEAAAAVAGSGESRTASAGR